jgi:hypothetical protein
VTVGAPIGVGTCPFEIWSRACSASCCILLSGAVRSATAHLPEKFLTLFDQILDRLNYRISGGAGICDHSIGMFDGIVEVGRTQSTSVCGPVPV